MRCIVEGFSVAFGICSFGSGVPVVPGFRRFKVVRGWVVPDLAVYLPEELFKPETVDLQH